MLGGLDQDFYQTESERACEAGKTYHPDNLTPWYVDFFRAVVEG
jgi:hypothetical protein